MEEMSRARWSVEGWAGLKPPLSLSLSLGVPPSWHLSVVISLEALQTCEVWEPHQSG